MLRANVAPMLDLTTERLDLSFAELDRLERIWVAPTVTPLNIKVPGVPESIVADGSRPSASQRSRPPSSTRRSAPRRYGAAT